MININSDKPHKESLQSRMNSSVELSDIKGLMNALAKDYFTAVTNITGNPRFINYYRNRIFPLERASGHYMDMIELVGHYVGAAIMKNPAELRGEELYREQVRTRKSEETLFRILIEPLSYVYDVMMGYKPYNTSCKENSAENDK